MSLLLTISAAKSSIEEFLDSIYLARADIGGSKLEDYAKSIERINKMLTLLNSAVDILRSKLRGISL